MLFINILSAGLAPANPLHHPVFNYLVYNPVAPFCSTDLFSKDMIAEYSKFYPASYFDTLSLAYSSGKPRNHDLHITEDWIGRLFESEVSADCYKKAMRNISLELPKKLEELRRNGLEGFWAFFKAYTNNMFTKISYSKKNLSIDETKYKEMTINALMNGILCPEMYIQFYLVTVADIILDLISKNSCGAENDNIITKILLDELLKTLNIMQDAKKYNISVKATDFADMLDNLVNSQCRLFTEMAEVYTDQFYDGNEPGMINERMNTRLRYEIKIQAIKKLFRARIMMYGARKPDKDDIMSSLTLFVDNTVGKSTGSQNSILPNEKLLNDIENIEKFYHENSKSFTDGAYIGRVGVRVLQNIGSRISMRNKYLNKDYTMNLIFINGSNTPNNDIFLYEAENKHILRIYKVFTNVLFTAKNTCDIECATVWTVTEGYESRLNKNYVKSIDDVMEILKAVLQGLKYLQENSIYFDNFDMDDIVVVKNVPREYKIDLRRAYSMNIPILGNLKTINTTHYNLSMDGFYRLALKLRKHLARPAKNLDTFIKLLEQRDSSNSYLPIDTLLQNLLEN